MSAITIIPGRGDRLTTATLRDRAIQKARSDVDDSIYNSLDALLEQWARDNYLTLDEKGRRKGIEAIVEVIR